MEAKLIKMDEYWHVDITEQEELIFDYNGTFDECVGWIWRMLGKKDGPPRPARTLPTPPVNLYEDGPEG